MLRAAFCARGLAADVYHHAIARHRLIVPEITLERFRHFLESELSVPTHLVKRVVDQVSADAFIPTGTSAASLGATAQNWDQAELSGIILSGAETWVTLVDPAYAEALPIGSPKMLNPREYWSIVRGSGV